MLKIRNMTWLSSTRLAAMGSTLVCSCLIVGCEPDRSHTISTGKDKTAVIEPKVTPPPDAGAGAAAKPTRPEPPVKSIKDRAK